MHNNSITPPPWEISDMSCCDVNGKYDICFQIGRSDTGETIAELNGEGERNYKHVKRNAELVKAAPELLDLLEDVIVYLSGVAEFSEKSAVISQAEYFADKFRQMKNKIVG